MSTSGRRTPILVAGFLVAILAIAVGTYAYDHGRRDVIANGVKIAGVDVGGLHSAAASAKIQRELIAPLDRPGTVRARRRSWQLSGRQAGLAVDTNALIAEAVQASRQGSSPARSSIAAAHPA